MKYSAIVFDLDGTLINTLEDLMNSVNFALEKCNFPKKNIDEIRRFAGNGVKKLVYLSTPESTSEETKEECLRIFKEHYTKHSCDKTAPYNGINEMLETVKAMGIKTAVVTNKMQEAAVDIITNFFGSYIDVIIGQIDGVAQKPAPDGVLLAMNKLEALPEETVYIGDSEVDCATAHNAALPIIGCTWGFRERKVLEENKAEYIINEPKEIIGIIK